MDIALKPTLSEVALYDTLESMHYRLCSLEGHKGAFSIKPMVENTQAILKTLQKVQNYEKTIADFVAKMKNIQAMCQAPSPDWMAIMCEVLDVLSGEEAPKEERDNAIIQTIENNLTIVDTLQKVAQIEEEDRRQGRIGVVFHAVSQVQEILTLVKNYKSAIKSVVIKFDLVRSELKKARMDAPTILSTCIKIIQIIQEEDIIKKQREDDILKCIKMSTEALRDTTASISRLQTVGCKRLGNPFSLVLGTLDQIIVGVDAVINYQRTIDEICDRYKGVVLAMQRLASISDVRQIIPCLLDLVSVLNDEDYAKMKRDWELVHTLESQNQKITDLTATLGGMGYDIC